MAALSLVIVLGLSGCGNTSGSNNGKATPTPAPGQPIPAGPSGQPPGNVALSPSPDIPIKHFDGVGVITKINQDLGSVELDHEEIKGLMPPMKMEYYLKEKSMLPGLKVGQKVDFTIEDRGGNESISAIKLHKEK